MIVLRRLYWTCTPIAMLIERVCIFYLRRALFSNNIMML